ncbi:EcsC family protein [Compostibacter hankyongensis]|uniref:EcsC family protein n=1 Tax=Compostibacter hankyongensis TaxID=1007089 RepID=A0ABP8FM78_9BACT
MNSYEQQALAGMRKWQRKMQRRPRLTGKLTKRLQDRMNRFIPEKVHRVITTAIKQMMRAVFFGAKYISPRPLRDAVLEVREARVLERINFYSKTAAAEGALTGAAGFLLGLADFPLWLTLKSKMLFDIAALYGYDPGEYPERLYLLYIFQLTFSSQHHRNRVYEIMAGWEDYTRSLPEDIHQFDWRSFQQEYRDYLDLAKMLQLVPGIGAVVGLYVNHRLTAKLGKTAMNAYRMRWFRGSE